MRNNSIYRISFYPPYIKSIKFIAPTTLFNNPQRCHPEQNPERYYTGVDEL